MVKRLISLLDLLRQPSTLPFVTPGSVAILTGPFEVIGGVVITTLSLSRTCRIYLSPYHPASGS